MKTRRIEAPMGSLFARVERTLAVVCLILTLGAMPVYPQEREVCMRGMYWEHEIGFEWRVADVVTDRKDGVIAALTPAFEDQRPHGWCVRKLDRKGDLLWDVKSESDRLVRIAARSNGNILCLLRMEDGKHRYGIVEISSAGRISREPRPIAGISPRFEGNALCLDRQGNIFVAGYLLDAGGSPQKKWCVASLTSAMVVRWLDLSVGLESAADSIAIGEEDSVCAGGYTAEKGDLPASRWLIRRYSNAGVLLWSITSEGGGNWDSAACIAADPKGGFISFGELGKMIRAQKRSKDGDLVWEYGWHRNPAFRSVPRSILVTRQDILLCASSRTLSYGYAPPRNDFSDLFLTPGVWEGAEIGPVAEDSAGHELITMLTRSETGKPSQWLIRKYGNGVDCFKASLTLSRKRMAVGGNVQATVKVKNCSTGFVETHAWIWPSTAKGMVPKWAYVLLPVGYSLMGQRMESGQERTYTVEYSITAVGRACFEANVAFNREGRSCEAYLSSPPLVIKEPYTAETIKSKEQDDLYRLAVLEFKGIGADAGSARLLGDIFRTGLSKRTKHKLLERQEITGILEEQAFQQTGITEGESAVRMGRLLNVRFIVLGNYGVIEGTHYLFIRCVDVETGGIEYLDRCRWSDNSQMKKEMDRLALELGEKIKG